MKLAFWNVRQNDDAALLLAATEAPDVMVIAECMAPSEVARALSVTVRRWQHVSDTGPRVAVFSRGSRCVARVGAERFCICRLRSRAFSLTLAAVHLRSRMHATASDISIDCGVLRHEIIAAERAARHRNTLVMGDFNLDPYDFGLCDRRLILGVMDRRLAARLDASSDEQLRGAVFYNPMWSRMGDDSPGPPGTFYASSEDHHDYRFHTFDQVFVRPALVPRLGAVTVPRRLGVVQLVSEMDLPRKAAVSDHLPVIVEIESGAADEPAET